MTSFYALPRPIDTLNKLLANTVMPYTYLEISHHRVSSSNIFIVEGNKKDGSDKIKSSNQSNLIDALMYIEIGDFSASDEALSDMRENYSKNHQHDPFILFAETVEDKISAHPFFYVCISKSSNEKRWKLHFSFNSYKKTSFNTLFLTEDLSESLEEVMMYFKSLTDIV
ncbi:hypothetical protein [Psychromonas sp. SP041]|uniref:hypothetical protein n=1 Tax=Psychromonas sp. SP041 TaxID=1365007 RepID=UPI0010C7A300|nr:hypothetical protein [Psychromonas sp. SP041]